MTVYGSALGCRLWPVAGDVLFDQLSRGFRQEEVNVHRLSAYSTWRAYRSVFTCLLSQVVQTGRVSFFTLTVASMQTGFCRAGRVNGTNTGKCSQSSKSTQDAFILLLCTIVQN